LQPTLSFRYFLKADLLSSQTFRLRLYQPRQWWPNDRYHPPNRKTNTSQRFAWVDPDVGRTRTTYAEFLKRPLPTTHHSLTNRPMLITPRLNSNQRRLAQRWTWAPLRVCSMDGLGRPPVEQQRLAAVVVVAAFASFKPGFVQNAMRGCVGGVGRGDDVRECV
jgi:hypothetical protein